MGSACLDYQDEALRGLKCKRVQCGEIWSFCHSKQANVPEDKKGLFGYEDIWTWTAICADSKVIPCWHVGTRDAEAANVFIANLASRLANWVQLTTDGHKAYLDAVEDAFAWEIDYAMLVKPYGGSEVKKVENHVHAISLHFMYYNFGRIHQSLRVTPAMEAGISDHVWSLEEIAGLVKEEAPKKRGPYKKRISN